MNHSTHSRSALRNVGRLAPLGDAQSITDRDAGVRFNTQVIARLQHRNPEIGGDVGWTTYAVSDLQLAGHGATDSHSVWLGELVVPDGLWLPTLRRPLEQAQDAASPADATSEPDTDWRVRIEEWQQFPGDPAPGGIEDQSPSVWERRLVYSDDAYL